MDASENHLARCHGPQHLSPSCPPIWYSFLQDVMGRSICHLLIHQFGILSNMTREWELQVIIIYMLLLNALSQRERSIWFLSAKTSPWKSRQTIMVAVCSCATWPIIDSLVRLCGYQRHALYLLVQAYAISNHWISNVQSFAWKHLDSFCIFKY